MAVAEEVFNTTSLGETLSNMEEQKQNFIAQQESNVHGMMKEAGMDLVEEESTYLGGKHSRGTSGQAHAPRPGGRVRQ